MSIVVSPNNRYVYVVNKGAGTLSIINSMKNKVLATIDVGAHPKEVAVSPDGKNVYVVNKYGNSLSIIQQ